MNVPGGIEPTGYAVTRLGKHSYGFEVIEKVDPRGRKYYWIGGNEYQHEDIPGSDCNAVLRDGLVSVTPLQLDLTDDALRPVIAALDGRRATAVRANPITLRFMGEPMRRNLQVAVLVTGMLSLLLSTGGAVAESGLDALVARLKGADAAARRQIMKSLSDAERKQVLAEYRALSREGKQAVTSALGRRKAKSDGVKRVPLGTVQYDTGTPFTFPDDTNDVVGNQFNTGFGNPHNISVVFWSQAGSFGFVPIRVYGAPVGTVAPVLASTTFLGSTFTWTLQPPIVNHSGSFLVGLNQSGSSTMPPSSFVAAVGVDINNGGQGFHGMNIKLNGTGFIPNATVAGIPYNAILRVSGLNLPVELMSFDVQ